MGYGLGIDLGTTSIKAAWCRDDRVGVVQLSPWSNVAPALTHLTGTDESAWVSGPSARTAGRATGLVRQAKGTLPSAPELRVGDVAVPPERVLGHQLRWAYEACAVYLGGEPQHVVVTHPGSWDPATVQRLVSAVANLGRMPTTFVTDAEAAATDWARSATGDSDLVVVSAGGGGTEVVGLRPSSGGRFKPVTRAIRDTALAGEELIDALARHLARTRANVAELAPADGYELARWALEAAVDDNELRFVLPNDRDRAPSSVTRTEVENVALPLVDGVVEHIRSTLTAAGARADTATILLTGGVARFPLFSERIRELLGTEPTRAGDPGLGVARGAARLAAAPTWPAQTPSPRPAHTPQQDDSSVVIDLTERAAVDRPIEQPVATVSRFRRPNTGTFTNVPDEIEVDKTDGVAELPPDRRLAVAAVVIAIVIVGLLLLGRAVLGG